jgi:hypothetical protein
MFVGQQLSTIIDNYLTENKPKFTHLSALALCACVLSLLKTP